MPHNKNIKLQVSFNQFNLIQHCLTTIKMNMKEDKHIQEMENLIKDLKQQNHESNSATTT